MSGLADMFSPKIPKAPELPVPVRQPDLKDPLIVESGKRRRREEEAREGRASTNLSPSYSNSLLGQ